MANQSINFCPAFENQMMLSQQESIIAWLSCSLLMDRLDSARHVTMATWDLDEADHFHYLTQGGKILYKSLFLQDWQLVRSTASACGQSLDNGVKNNKVSVKSYWSMNGKSEWKKIILY